MTYEQAGHATQRIRMSKIKRQRKVATTRGEAIQKRRKRRRGIERELVRRGKRMEKKSGRRHGCTETDMNGL